MPNTTHEAASTAGAHETKETRRTAPCGSAVTSEPLADVDLANRLMFLMVNEAARCIEEKVVESPEDADYGMILGSGFAPHHGGPLRFAEHFGLKKIVEEMNRLAKNDDKFVPCQVLQKHARDGTKFYES